MVKLNYIVHVTVFYKEDIIKLAHIFLIILPQSRFYLKTDPTIA